MQCASPVTISTGSLAREMAAKWPSKRIPTGPTMLYEGVTQSLVSATLSKHFQSSDFLGIHVALPGKIGTMKTSVL